MVGGFSLQERFPFLSGLRLDEGAKRHQPCTCTVLGAGSPCILCPGASLATPKSKSCFLYPSPSVIHLYVRSTIHPSIHYPASPHPSCVHSFIHSSLQPLSIHPLIPRPSVHPFIPHFSLLSRQQAQGAQCQLNGGSRLRAVPRGKVGQSRGQPWDQHNEGPGDASPSVNQSVSQSVHQSPSYVHPLHTRHSFRSW